MKTNITVTMTKKVYDEIKETIGTIKPEQGGILGTIGDNPVITNFVHDKDASVGIASYTPNIKFLEEVMNNEWLNKGVELIGFIHSHPGNCSCLSYADIEYAGRIMEAIGYDSLFMPIVNITKQGDFLMYGYIIFDDGSVEDCDINVIEEEEEEVIESNEQAKEIPNDQFTRINKCLPLDYLKETCVIGVGCGGSRGLYIDLARMGVGKFFLIDGDTVSITNIATQHTFLSEEGKLKTECIKKQILDINPNCEVVCISKMLDDEISDEFLEENIISKIDPSKTVICGFTDSFYAQARVNNIAMKYNIPTLSSQHHKYGETSEIIYFYPGISTTTPREILNSRYTHYLNGYKNDVTSEGGVIFGTTRLNGLCEKLVMGMLLFAYNDSNVFSAFLNLKPERNLIIIKQYPVIFGDLSDIFDCDDEFELFDEPVWIDTTVYQKDEIAISDDTKIIE